MRIGILGAGALGSWFGGKLSSVCENVELLTTNQLHRDAVNRDGLLLVDSDGESRVKLDARHPEDYSGDAELIFLLTKVFQSDTALSMIADRLHPDTFMLSLQNGLGNAEIIGRFVANENILIGNTMLPVDKLAPGVVEVKGQGATYLGGLHPLSAKFGEQLAELATSAGLDMQADPQIMKRIWHKVAFNAGMNAVIALSGGNAGKVDDTDGAKALVKAIATEAVLVAAADGINIDVDAVHATIDYACTHHRDHKVSMLQDLESGRRTEIDALNTAIARLGRQHHIATPLNRALETLVRLTETSLGEKQA